MVVVANLKAVTFINGNRKKSKKKKVRKPKIIRTNLLYNLEIHKH